MFGAWDSKLENFISGIEKTLGVKSTDECATRSLHGNDTSFVDTRHSSEAFGSIAEAKSTPAAMVMASDMTIVINENHKYLLAGGTDDVTKELSIERKPEQDPLAPAENISDIETAFATRSISNDLCTEYTRKIEETTTDYDTVTPVAARPLVLRSDDGFSSPTIVVEKQQQQQLDTRQAPIDPAKETRKRQKTQKTPISKEKPLPPSLPDDVPDALRYTCHAKKKKQEIAHEEPNHHQGNIARSVHMAKNYIYFFLSLMVDVDKGWKKMALTALNLSIYLVLCYLIIYTFGLLLSILAPRVSIEPNGESSTERDKEIAAAILSLLGFGGEFVRIFRYTMYILCIALWCTMRYRGMRIFDLF